jgi:hypothetical protein
MPGRPGPGIAAGHELRPTSGTPQGWSLPATGAAWAAVLGSFILAAFAGRSVVLVVVVVVVLDVALQAVAILNQLRVFAVSHEARSRLNTAYVTCNFIGGAVGLRCCAHFGASSPNQ